MKATGILRRIDDLGRVVIPKEIRRTMNIREGDELEIFTTDNGVVFAKYDRTPYKEKEAQEWLERNSKIIANRSARFTIDGDTTVCECIVNGARTVGTTKRDPHDTFNPSVGMVYAFCRATKAMLPEGW